MTYVTPVGTDNCAGAVTTRTAGLASGATFPIGVTTVTYLVTDASGQACEARDFYPFGERIASGDGPTKVMPWSAQISAKRSFSARKP